MGSTDSLDSGKDSAVDEQSPQHVDGRPPPSAATAAAAISSKAFGVDARRRRGDGKGSPPIPAVREHHNRSKSADGDSGSGSARKTHAKSLSVGDDSFDHKIQLWRKRADSQGSIDRPKPLPAARHCHQQNGQQVFHHQQHHHPQQHYHFAADPKGSGGAPDLVMDLPVGSETGGCSTSGSGAADATAETRETAGNAVSQEPDSPDMGTAAERFAKQNQCTLKKYSKPVQANGKPELPPKSSKPPLKAKPQIFKKPVFLASKTNDGTAPQP